MRKNNKLLLPGFLLGLAMSILPGCSLNSSDLTSTDELTSIASQVLDDNKLVNETFTCERTSKGKWATIANTTRGKIPMILWESPYFSQSGWTPKDRCFEVTERFQEYEKKDWLNYITTSRMKGYDVLVATENPKGKQRDLVDGGLLITLRKDQNPNEELRKLMEVRDGASSSPVSHAVEAAQVFDEQGRLYINVEVLLSQAPVME